MNIRRALPEEFHQLRELATQVFETEQDIPRALDHMCPDWLPQWWCLEEDGVLLGCVALFREDDAWHMGRFVLSPALRGRHMGTQLLEVALHDVFQQDIDEVTMEARDTTVHILKKFGAEVTGAPFPFYRGQVTPMRLTRAAYRQSRNDRVQT